MTTKDDDAHRKIVMIVAELQNNIATLRNLRHTGNITVQISLKQGGIASAKIVSDRDILFTNGSR